MPWKGIKDPYRIWLSEVILQQTRVEQGISYYQAFVKAYPTVHKLAQAPENEVFKIWEGLGYYSRCRNLIHTAKRVSQDLKGEFPTSREGLISLKGVGPYTAAAIGSFAFGLPLAVVDGNVMRVLSRFFGIKTPIDSTSGKKMMEEVADALLDKKDPAWFNQAMMDLGATVCKPQSPDCATCPLQKKCIAFSQKKQSLFPVKTQKVKQKKRFLFYLILESKGQVLIRQR
ncbi:MAG: A/G-specific adenine glycosylase, partial [Bacteroidota bacterium]